MTSGCRETPVGKCYSYDPDPARLELSGFLRRRQGDLVEIESMHGHVSPRLKVKFEMGEPGLRLFRPDGQPFLTYQEQALRADRLQAELDQLRRGAGRPPGAGT
jgi:hypothetical protein